MLLQDQRVRRGQGNEKEWARCRGEGQDSWNDGSPGLGALRKVGEEEGKEGWGRATSSSVHMGHTENTTQEDGAPWGRGRGLQRKGLGRQR